MPMYLPSSNFQHLVDASRSFVAHIQFSKIRHKGIICSPSAKSQSTRFGSFSHSQFDWLATITFRLTHSLTIADKQFTNLFKIFDEVLLTSALCDNTSIIGERLQLRNSESHSCSSGPDCDWPPCKNSAMFLWPVALISNSEASVKCDWSISRLLSWIHFISLSM